MALDAAVKRATSHMLELVMFQAIGPRTGLVRLRAGQLVTRHPIASHLATTISAASVTYLVTVRLIALLSKMIVILQSLLQSQSPLLTQAQSQALNPVQSQAQSRAQSLVLIMRNCRRLLQKSLTA